MTNPNNFKYIKVEKKFYDYTLEELTDLISGISKELSVLMRVEEDRLKHLSSKRGNRFARLYEPTNTKHTESTDSK